VSDEEPTDSPTVGPRAGLSGPMGAAGMPVERSKDLKSTTRRLAQRLRPHRLGLIAVLALAVGSVTLSVLGPRILGHATNVIIAGVRGHNVDFG
jgi:ATP-binding cassette subfamily B multidrug efflux pump